MFKVGDYVYATEGSSIYYVKALIISYDSETLEYTVQFEDENTENKQCDELKIYFPCDCVYSNDKNPLLY